ncbi:MAG TPA: glycogen debranching protein, partial [Pseudonocardiaceae bacterium]|nr:glycogen debranching protein [Pseudonocardiaceae bacterium]
MTVLPTAGVRRRLSAAALAAKAAYVLRGNDLGTMTTAAPRLYPHMWSWDAAFVAIGLAAVALERAVLELDTLLAAQWATGMIPHIVFAPETNDYFPGPDRWGCRESGAPVGQGPRTSGICQPPVHAIAVQRIVAAGRLGERTERSVAEEFLARAWGPMMAWHRWLASARDPLEEGLITLYHGWESGMDNSPRWDGPYSRVRVGPDLPPYRRRDTAVVGDATQRPSDLEYDRYLWLVEQMRRVGYADSLVRSACDFAVKDAFVS